MAKRKSGGAAAAIADLKVDRVRARADVLWIDRGGKLEPIGGRGGILVVPLDVAPRGRGWSIVVEARGVDGVLLEVEVEGDEAAKLFARFVARRIDDEIAPLWAQHWRLLACGDRIVWTLDRTDDPFVTPDEGAVLRDVSALVARARARPERAPEGDPDPVQTSAPPADQA